MCGEAPVEIRRAAERRSPGALDAARSASRAPCNKTIDGEHGAHGEEFARSGRETAVASDLHQTLEHTHTHTHTHRKLIELYQQSH